MQKNDVLSVDNIILSKLYMIFIEPN